MDPITRVPAVGEELVMVRTVGILGKGTPVKVLEVRFNDQDEDQGDTDNVSELLVQDANRPNRKIWANLNALGENDVSIPKVKGANGKLMSVEIVRTNASNGVAAVVLPEGMTIEGGISFLQAKKREEEQVVQINETFECHPYEGALAFKQAIVDRYGVNGAISTPGFFGPTPPQVVKLPVNAQGDTEEIYISPISLPQWKGEVTLSPCPAHTNKRGEAVLTIHGTMKKRYDAEVTDLVRRTRENIAKRSLYKGKAIRLEFDPESAGGMFQAAHGKTPSEPEFMDVSKVDPSKLILPDGVQALVNTSLFLPAQHPDICRAQGIPLKRGTLLVGPYGTGKTLTATTLAKLATDAGVTFIYLKDVNDLAQALRFAQRYAPTVLFAEDVDALMGTEERTDEVNDVLNTIDGVDTKGAEIMMVLTSNHPEKLNRAMLRPGRIDTLIPFTPPDARAAFRLLRSYGGDLVMGVTDSELNEVAKSLEGQIPAVFREVVERAKLVAIHRMLGKGMKPNGHGVGLITDDLRSAASSVLVQQSILKEAPSSEVSPGDAFVAEIVERVIDAQEEAEA